jgi:uncharacterized protein (TIGR00297 family)
MISQTALIGFEITFSVSVGLFAFQKKSISKTGLATLLLICGLFIGLQQIRFLIVLFSMFASSSILSKIKKAEKAGMENVIGKSTARNATQALANLGIAVVAFSCYYLLKDPAFVYAFLGSVAASNADTWASEIGSISKQDPVMITTFKKVEKGISGGVTLLGSFGGIAGAAFISLIGVLVINEHAALLKLFLISFISGVAGFMFDSYIGALFQATYKSEDSGKLTEVKSSKLVKGVAWLNNDGVNLLTTLVGAAFAYLLFKIIPIKF